MRGKTLLACVAWLVGFEVAAGEPPARPDPQRARALYREALAAREARDVAGYRGKLEEAARALPDPANLWFRLAGARALVGERELAFAALEAQVAAGIHRADFETHADLAPLRGQQRWAPLAAAHAKLAESVTASEILFRLPERELLVEGIARDAASGDLFFSSVRQRKIVRRAADGALSTFAVVAGKLPGSPLGIAVDAGRRRLWVVTAGLPQGENLPAEEKERSALAAFDLETGELALRVDAPAGALLNDLALAADGTVYASDPGRGAVVRWRPAATALEEVVAPGTLVSPGGLALAPDGSTLHVADWGYGLAAFDLASGALRWLTPPAGAATLGIDGLVRDGDALLAIQNGVAPARVVRFLLGTNGVDLQRAELLERAHPDWVEPTLGLVFDDALLYVGSSQWPRFPEDGSAPDPSTLVESAIHRLRLP
jgi:sugar lactone lactonase YvrE